MSHYRSQCRHGRLRSQCRCRGPKETRIVECAPTCPHRDEPPRSHEPVVGAVIPAPAQQAPAPPQPSGTRAYRCQGCDGLPNWRLDRRGDAVVSWACDDDLIPLLRELQRSFERTEIVVRQHIPTEDR